ncbi:hypothetical protein ECEC1846_2869 [Escherichia coli EC1846]|uniref:Uncharacterized protein n=1 Tax=Escherichia coli 3.4880 TaxID=1051347 RepID=A0AAV3I5T8_ECOLX|nr:hypothetical protein SS52_2849 [Escherichia coli O157:H7 str. SS52]EDU67670.1 hypothetical protein ECH7EC4076_0981 [Escherichia coli O157:H7 str. EC4076]EIN23559.1 hypothetical protein ECFDA517_3185 [Escherichia coli FDA517]EIN41539.1 hypothetical protein ECFRIK1985_3129 [Escherichia coli FRIK1985]EIN87064.1 hypothetical protein ECPA22_3275 [Escherichia coli PA22]EIO39413.1 hypothetical protein ECPA39_2950 [Escherichia coli PA39]EIO82897.1 hypothetical protein ECTW10119_3246 [Escherichia c
MILLFSPVWAYFQNAAMIKTLICDISCVCRALLAVFN